MHQPRLRLFKSYVGAKNLRIRSSESRVGFLCPMNNRFPRAGFAFLLASGLESRERRNGRLGRGRKLQFCTRKSFPKLKTRCSVLHSLRPSVHLKQNCCVDGFNDTTLMLNGLNSPPCCLSSSTGYLNREQCDSHPAPAESWTL